MSMWPLSITVGTSKAYERNYASSCTKHHIGDEYLYMCTIGCQWATPGECLVLRQGGGFWMAWDSSKVAGSNGEQQLHCRQRVFRCADDILQPGVHDWETNLNANESDTETSPNWQSGLQAETRVG